jgi:hypothetical protein
MNQIVAEIDAEIRRLREVRTGLLMGSEVRDGHQVGRSAGKRRKMSAEGRARIAAAERARWAKQKRAAK